MKLRSLLCIMMIIFMMSLTVYAHTSAGNNESDLTLTGLEETNVKKTYSILFIGNSYTFYNDMPTAIFEKIAESAGYDVEITSITKGSHKLSQFADPKDEYGAKVEKALTGAKNYDYVILQEQSVRPAGANAPDFYSAVRNLSERIRAAGAKPVLYSTWGRKTGSSTLESNGWTNESMTWKLAAGYQAIGDELDIPVAHVGLAFYDVYTNQSSIELYNADKSHPSYAGSYLAAACLFAKIFNIDPTNFSFVGDLSATNANILCEAARKAVFETPVIPDEYKTASRFAIIKSTACGNKTTADIAFATAGTYTVIFADYDGGKLVDVDIVDVEIDRAKTVSITSEKDIILGTGDRIMVWNSTESICPVCTSYKIIL